MTLALILSALLQQGLRQESTWFYSDGFCPNYVIPSRPWSGIAVDSKGRVYVLHPHAIGAGNRSLGAGQLRIYSPDGEEIAAWSSAPGFFPAHGLGIDERQGRLYVAGDMQQVFLLEWKGPGNPVSPKPSPLGKKDGGRCAGVSVGRDGGLFTADLAENRIYRFYPAGGSSSFGSGPGEGDQGFNNVRRVYEMPGGELATLDTEGVKIFGPTGRFLRRIGKRIPGADWVLAPAPDGTLLVGTGTELLRVTLEGKTLKSFPAPAVPWVDAAVGPDGSIYGIPRGEEYCYAKLDADGRPVLQRGADFERLTVTLPRRELEAGARIPVTVALADGLRAQLLAGALKKAAEARGSKVQAFIRGETWQKLALEAGHVRLPAGLKGSATLRFTTALSGEGPGPTVDFAVTLR